MIFQEIKIDDIFTRAFIPSKRTVQTISELVQNIRIQVNHPSINWSYDIIYKDTRFAVSANQFNDWNHEEQCFFMSPIRGKFNIGIIGTRIELGLWFGRHPNYSNKFWKLFPAKLEAHLNKMINYKTIYQVCVS